MWLTPWRSSTSRVRSATSWVTRDRDAAPKTVRVLLCPVRPKSATWIATHISVFLAPFSSLGGPLIGDVYQVHERSPGRHVPQLRPEDTRSRRRRRRAPLPEVRPSAALADRGRRSGRPHFGQWGTPSAAART